MIGVGSTAYQIIELLDGIENGLPYTDWKHFVAYYRCQDDYMWPDKFVLLEEAERAA
jgi:hypothetical protein